MDKIFFSYGNFGSEHNSKFNEINKYLAENPSAKITSVTPTHVNTNGNYFGFVIVVSNK